MKSKAANFIFRFLPLAIIELTKLLHFIKITGEPVCKIPLRSDRSTDSVRVIE